MRKKIFIIFAILTSLVCQAQFKDVRIGDIIQINGVKGIVFKVSDDGEHGQMMSVKAFRAKKDLFCLKGSYLKGMSMLSETDGKQNTRELFDYCSSNGIPLANFPVFNWCKSLGEGWYVPSILQLKSFINYWLGNTELELVWDEDEDSGPELNDDTSPHTKIVNDLLLNAGGIPFLNGVFSSTLDKNKKADIFQYNREDGKWTFKKVNPMKIDSFCVGRAFYDF